MTVLAISQLATELEAFGVETFEVKDHFDYAEVAFGACSSSSTCSSSCASTCSSTSSSCGSSCATA